MRARRIQLSTFACSLAACTLLHACSGEVGPGGFPRTRTGGSTSTTAGGTDTSTSSSSSSTSSTSGSTGEAGSSATSGPTTGGTTGSSGQGGAGGGSGGAGGGKPDAGPNTGDELQFCLEEHNRYRALVGSPPLVRSAEVEQFAAEGAKYDYDAKSAHKHFGDFVRGTNIVAENEAPGWGGWSVKAQGSVHGVIIGGLKAMWDEGPGGGHYENMKDPKHKALGCGIYVAPNANQDVTLTVDFTN